MNTRSKFILFFSIILGVIITLPVLAEAPVNSNNLNREAKREEMQSRRELRQEDRQEKRMENVCQRISDMSSRAEEANSDKKSSADRLANWQERIAAHDARLEKTRSDWNENREAQFKKLEEKATTDVQKKAVVDFEAAVASAISARRTAVDAALSAFRSGVKDLIATRAESTNGNAVALADATKAAFDKAKTDCASGVDASTIRTTLKSSLQAAKTKFRSSKQAAPKVGGDIQALITTRRQAVEKAMTDFKAAMEKARTDLKKAFPSETAEVK